MIFQSIKKYSLKLFPRVLALLLSQNVLNNFSFQYRLYLLCNKTECLEFTFRIRMWYQTISRKKLLFPLNNSAVLPCIAKNYLSYSGYIFLTSQTDWNIKGFNFTCIRTDKWTETRFASFDAFWRSRRDIWNSNKY